jgi:hypothetical protein
VILWGELKLSDQLRNGWILLGWLQQLLLKQSQFSSFGHGLGPPVDVELAVDILGMRFDRIQ